MKLNAPLVAGGYARSVMISPDSARVVYTAAETHRLRAEPLRDPAAARPPLPPRGRADASG